jgi:hypothetical protein
MYQKKSYKWVIIKASLVTGCSALCAFFVYFPITDTDIFWHLAAGREIVTQKQFLFHDPFAFSLASPKWIDLHWLFQVVVYGLHCLGGEKALLAFKILTVAAVAGILCLTRRSLRSIVVTSFLAAALVYEARYLICLRPVLITILCMAIYFFLFENVRERADKKILWLCIPLQIIWTNSQGLYPVGLFIVGAYWLEAAIRYMAKKREKPLFMTCLLVLVSLSCVLTPYGLDGLRLPFSLIGRISPDHRNVFSLYISENVPLFSLSGYDAVYRTVVLATAALAIVFFILNGREIRLAHYTLFTGFALLAYMAERNVLLFIVCVIPIIGYHASRCPAVLKAALFLYSRRKWAYTLCAPAVFFLLFAVIRHSMVVSTYPPGRTLSPFRFPEHICEYLKQNPYKGKMFNDIRFGGYLTWHLFPSKQVFIDGRLIIRQEEFFRDYLAICRNPELFPKVVERFDITHVILPWAIFGLHQNLIRWLYASEQWHLEYTDGASTLFVRNDIENKPGLRLHEQAVDDAILDSIGEQWKTAPYVRDEAMGYFAEMLDSLGLPNAAKMVKIRMRELRDREKRNY